ncbi:phosphate signaling complex PhoU family protein [Natrialbaceae archaeon AArc-T1-2]|uniref:phosphate signaling complex PhoU family protein n=1 Tax=Natrialbaceae archaeon AArc-T1-2 TaxID=3053904 RepID=UPI00255B00E5|nr:phosphate uptake regulator PhoU [Natrialbaceae archaeon AArc-T1-2]WIV68186.1 phosphate uptake regulator PhoU [Natrialbaceae archaeon AArc-T1-2]
MERRKVQQLGGSTLAVSLPLEWVEENGVEKGDEVYVPASRGCLRVVADQGLTDHSTATIHAEELGEDALERAIIAQYVLGRRTIRITHAEDTLASGHITAVYDAESQLMGLGIVEEAPGHVVVRCSVDPADFNLAELLERLESTGRTIRDDAMKALAYANPELVRNVTGRERQANRIFVLLLRLIYTGYQNPIVAREICLDDELPLIAYRSIAKNLELTADSSQALAELVVEINRQEIDVDDTTVREIRNLSDRIDEIARESVTAAIERDYDLAMTPREHFRTIVDHKDAILDGLDGSVETQSYVRDVLVRFQQIAEHSLRNAEIAANIALVEDSEYVTVGN